MSTLLHMLDEGDFFPMLMLIGVLAYVGGKMADAAPPVRSWGWRTAAGAFVAYSIRGGLVFHPQDADDCLHIVLRGLLAAGLALTVSWVLLSVASFVLWHLLVLAQASSLRARLTARHRREAEQISNEQALRQQADHYARERSEATQKAEACRRRDDARMRCLMLYDRHSTTLAERFPRERLQEYFDHYMSDSSSPEIVEERARTLIALIDEWVVQDKTRQKKEFRTLEELATFFQKQRDEVAGLSYGADIKDSFITNINIQEEQAVRRFLSS